MPKARRFFKKITMYIVRTMSDKTTGSSSPCEDCHRKLVSLGIKRIIYTCKNSEIMCQKPTECIPYGPSTGRRYIKNDFKYSGTESETETETESETET